MSHPIYRHAWPRNPLLFRACFDILSRPRKPGETYEWFVQEKVYGAGRKRPREERQETATVHDWYHWFRSVNKNNVSP